MSFFATFVDQVKADQKFKAVIGIDFGTTYSGVAYVARQNSQKVNYGAPGSKNSRDETKVPTVLLKRPDNTWAFGNEAIVEHRRLLDTCMESMAETGSAFDVASAAHFLNAQGGTLFREFKMQLKDKTSGFDTLTAKSTSGEPHSLLDLTSKALQFLSEFALDEIKQGWLKACNVAKDDVLWVLTVPAIWNDFGKAFMRKAAFRCGMIRDEGSDHLLLAIEPESAAIAVHRDATSYGILSEGASFIMLDVGGGTADFTVHKVSRAKPLLLDEIVPPVGGPWGGAFVEKQFRTFLERLIGSKFAQLEQYHSVELEEIIDEFRALKEDFDPDTNAVSTISLGALFTRIPDLLQLVVNYNASYVNYAKFDLSRKRTGRLIEEQYILTFSHEQMLEFFEPTLASICSCVRQTLTLEQCSETSALVIVGGYGSSKVLRNRIECEFSGAPFYKMVVKPDAGVRPQNAIVCGAACFGLYTSIIGSRIAKYTYGVEANDKYDGASFSPDEAEYDEWLEEFRIRKVFSQIVPVGTGIAPLQKFVRKDYFPIYKDQTSIPFVVYRSESPNPRLTTDPGCTKVGSVTLACKGTDKFDVAFTFGSEIRVDVTSADGEKFASTTVSLDD